MTTSNLLTIPKPRPIVYPETDGKPMAENTLQFRWIVTIQGGLDSQYAHDPNVFVAGDLFWYPVEGHPEIVQAPDILVAKGRPRGDRRSYMQWLEGGIAPRVVWEILSHSNRLGEMLHKFDFYDKYGVQEYYIFDPEKLELSGWIRDGGRLREIPDMNGWVSPELGIQFELTADDLRIIGPNGPFLTYLEVVEEKDSFQRLKEQAEQQKEQAERQKEQAEHDKLQAQQTVERLRAQLKAMGHEPQA